MGFKACDLTKYLRLISLTKGFYLNTVWNFPSSFGIFSLLFFITQGDKEDIGKVGERGNELDLRVLT